jgi:hypothetical protein
LLVIGLDDEERVQRAHRRRRRPIGLARHRVQHVQQVLGVAQIVARVGEGLAQRIFVGHRGDRRHLGNQAVRGDEAVARIEDVEAVVVEGGERANHPAHHRHRVRIAAEPAVDHVQLLVDHRVVGDVAREFLLLRRARQFAVEQEPRDFEVVALPDQLIDRIAAIKQDARVAVDIGDRRAARPGRAERGVVGPIPGLLAQPPRIDHRGPERRFEQWQLRLDVAALDGDGLRDRVHDILWRAMLIQGVDLYVAAHNVNLDSMINVNPCC